MIKKRGVEWLIIAIIAVAMIIAQNATAQIIKDDYNISQSSIDKKIKIGNYREVPLAIANSQDKAITVGLSLEGNITKFVKLSSARINIQQKSEETINISFFADELGFFNGTLIIS